LREYTRYAVQELVQPLEFEKVISEIIFNLGQDPAYPDRNYPDIRYIGGNKDYGHDAISITWETEEFVKTVFAFSKRKDWQNKLIEDLNKRSNDKSVRLFIYITTERVGAWKTPEKLAELGGKFGFTIDIIDIEDIVIWLDNTLWGKSIKRKYNIDSDEVFIYLKPYDIALQSDERKEEFFRIMGPIEIDFTKGIIFRRNEVDLIIKKIKENRIHIIRGPPASGKTVLARNICYELNRLFNIYWLDMDDLIDDTANVYSEILRLNRSNSLIVLENGHKSIKKLENLIDYFTKNTKTIKMLITARNDDGETKFTRKIAQIIGYENYCTKINASDVANSLIEFYSSRFGKIIDQDRDKFTPFEDDLWLLSYLFKAYVDKGEIDENIICEKVREDLIEYDGRIGIGASDIILLISWITQNSAILPEVYERESNYIPIDDFFLIDKLGYDHATVSSLTRLGIIKKVNEGYWCWHTSLSRIYIKTAEVYPSLLLRINSKFKEILGDSFDEDLDIDENINICHAYLRIHPEHTHSILSITGCSGLLLMKWENILNNLDTRDLIYTSLRKSNLEQINSIIHIINIFGFMKDQDILYRELIDELGPDRVKDKLRGCRNPKELVRYAYLFYRMDKEVGAKIIDEFEDEIIKNINELDHWVIGDILLFIFEISPHLSEIIIGDRSFEDYLKSLNLIDLTKFLQDLNRIRRIEQKLYPTRDTNWLQVCTKFLNRNMNSMKQIMERDKNRERIDTILSCISAICYINKDEGRKIVNLIGESFIISRLNEIENLTELRYAIFGIEHIYSEFKLEILKEFTESIESKIEINGIYSVAYFFGSLFKDSKMLDNDKETLLQILNLMDKNIIKTMKESSLYPFCEFIYLGI